MPRPAALLAALVLAGGSAPGLPRDSAAALQPCDGCVPGVENFAQVSPALWRGAQPTAVGFRALERLGARTVVSLRSGADDADLLQGTRLRYLRIPAEANHPDPATLAKVLKVLEDPGNWPVFLHCAQGRDRTGYHVAAYRMVVQGWTAEAAITELHRFHFNRVWVQIPRALGRLDVAAVKAQVKRESAPRFRTWSP